MYFSTVKSLTEHKRVCLAKNRRLTGPGRSRGNGHASRIRTLSDMIDDEFVDEDDMVAEEEAGSAEDLDVRDEKEDAVDLEESETNPMVSVPSGGIEIIRDLREWLKSPWSTD